MLRLSIQLHKWIALVVAVQVLGWVLGGLVMISIPIGVVRGENHAAVSHAAPIDLKSTLSLPALLAKADMESIRAATLKNSPRGPIWELTTSYGGEAWFNAVTGENVEAISEAQAKQAAAAAYQGPGHPVKVVHYDDAPIEAGATGEVYRVEFDDPERSSLYMSAFSGEVLSRRSNIWRFYNFFYQIHIMNFSGAQNYNHPTIIVATALTLTVVVTGFILLWIRVARDLKNWRSRRAPAV
jgi:uncharacterized iron-regulated membrane protein